MIQCIILNHRVTIMAEAIPYTEKQFETELRIVTDSAKSFGVDVNDDNIKDFLFHSALVRVQNHANDLMICRAFHEQMFGDEE